jgi:hypothetical protein
MNSPSPAYLAAVAEGQRHHLSSKTYSGSFLRVHKPFLSELIARLGIESALDYGCGKGAQYEWIDPADGLTLEQAWGFPVEKYDPCYPPFATEPTDQFDLVMCTHTISLIPLSDLEWVTRRILEFADKAVFIAEKIGDRKKGEIADPHNRAIAWSAEQWTGWFGRFAPEFPSLEIVLSTRTREERGKITTRHTWREGAYQGAAEAEPVNG